LAELPAILSGKPVFDEFVPIVRPCLPQLSQLAPDIDRILKTGALTKGTHLDAFEKAVAEHVGAKYAVGVSSCTMGLFLSYSALDLRGDVIIPSFTFLATASSLVVAGLRPVFADVNPETANLDPESVEAAITPDTCAIVAVHAFGNPADIEALIDLAQRRRLTLIFDAAHGFGSLYKGAPVGPQGDAQVFSMSPTKLVIAGEGGMVVTNDEALYEKLRVGREYGMTEGYDSAFASLNGRLAEFNALLGLNSLRMLEEAVSNRNKTAILFRKRLERLPGIGFQKVDPRNRSSYKDFSITIDPDSFGLTRDELATALKAENIDSRAYYHPPVHMQTAYKALPRSVNLTNTELLASRSLSLPMWSRMSEEIADKICAAIKRAQAHSEEIKGRLRGG
jgi:dTDP-4-amino-4,6-dideoxygalactose transaminase